MKNVLAFCAVTAAVLTFGASANAATVTALGAGVGASSISNTDRNTYGLTAGLADFNPLPVSTTPYGGQATQGQFTDGGASFSTGGILMTNPPPLDSDSLYAEPYHDTTQYLSVQPAADTVTVDFGAVDYSKLGLYWGSMDTYNSIQFCTGPNGSGDCSTTVSGSDAANAVFATAQGLQGDDSNNRYIVISDITFESIILTSSQKSFELDNLAWGPSGSGAPLPTPLPGALPLLGSVLGGALAFGRFRRRKAA